MFHGLFVPKVILLKSVSKNKLAEDIEAVLFYMKINVLGLLLHVV